MLKNVGEMNCYQMKEKIIQHWHRAKIENVSTTVGHGPATVGPDRATVGPGRASFNFNLVFISILLNSDEIMIVQILFGLTIGICLLITASACLVKNISGKTDNTKDFFPF